jgi:D-galactarolactone cycloisomerase
MLEFDRTDNPYRQAILKRPLEHADGWVTIPDGPGLGIEVDRDVLAEYAIDPA